MKTKVKYILLGVAGFTISFALSRATTHGGETFAATPPFRQPFTAAISRTMYTANGQKWEVFNKTYSRFSDGSFALKVVQTSPTHVLGDEEVANMATGEWIMLDSLTKSKTTLKYKPSELQGLILSLDSESCPGQVNLKQLPAAGKILGVDAVVYHDDENTEWQDNRLIAPSLSCFSLKTSTRDKGGARNEEIVTSLVSGEPNVNLLLPPVDFVERNPAMVDQLHKVASGGSPRFGSVFADHLALKYNKPSL